MGRWFDSRIAKSTYFHFSIFSEAGVEFLLPPRLRMNKGCPWLIPHELAHALQVLAAPVLMLLWKLLQGGGPKLAYLFLWVNKIACVMRCHTCGKYVTALFCLYPTVRSYPVEQFFDSLFWLWHCLVIQLRLSTGLWLFTRWAILAPGPYNWLSTPLNLDPTYYRAKKWPDCICLLAGYPQIAFLSLGSSTRLTTVFLLKTATLFPTFQL